MDILLISMFAYSALHNHFPSIIYFYFYHIHIYFFSSYSFSILYMAHLIISHYLTYTAWSSEFT